jgi:hypothetical protein
VLDPQEEEVREAEHPWAQSQTRTSRLNRKCAWWLLVISSMVGVARAEDPWLSLGKADDGSYVSYVDISSIRTSGSVRRAWIKMIYAPHTKSVAGGRWVSYTLGHMAFDCNHETYRSEAVLAYFDDGTNFATYAKDLDKRWAPIPPQTEISEEMFAVCAGFRK